MTLAYLPFLSGDVYKRQVEWVCTTPPISGNALYRTTWVGVSEDGRREPQTFNREELLEEMMNKNYMKMFSYA